MRRDGGIPFETHRPLVAVAVAGLLGGVLFAVLGSSLTYPRLGAPLDDAFIHLQYARQLGDLHFYAYQDGAAASSGATSWLYLHALGAFALFGLDGDALLAVGLLAGVISWAATGVLAYLLTLRLSDRRHALWASAVTLSSGALLWATASGMEVIAAAALLLAALLTYDRFREAATTEARNGCITSLSLLALVRPEGGYAALLLWAPLITRAWREPGERRQLRSLSPWLCVPFAFALPYLTTLITTGRVSSNGLVAKSELHNPELDGISEVLMACFENGKNIIAFLNGTDALRSGWLSFAPPCLLAVAVCASVVALVGQTRRGRTRVTPFRSGDVGTVPAAWLAIGLWAASVATLTYWSLHNYRYLLPLIPVLYVLTAVALYRVEGSFLRHSSFERGWLVTALGISVLVLQLTALPRWGQRLSQEAASIRAKQGSVAAWIEQNTNEDDLVALNDAGLLTYECGRPTYDLVGLMESQELARAYRAGEGAVYESLTAPEVSTAHGGRPGETIRPDWFAVFPDWFEQLEAFGVLGEPVLQIPDPFFPKMEKVVYRPSWSSVGRADTPRASSVPYPGWNVIGALDVGDVRSESLHDYHWTTEPGRPLDDPYLFRRNFGYHEEIQTRYPLYSDSEILKQLNENGRLADFDIIDTGRRHSGRESYTVRNVDPGRPLAIVIRTCDDREDRDAFHYTVRVSVDGVSLSDWHLRGTPWNWYERWYIIPATSLERSETRIELSALPTSDAAWFVSTYYWFCQPREPVPG